MLLPAVLALMQILSVPSRPITVAAGDATSAAIAAVAPVSPTVSPDVESHAESDPVVEPDAATKPAASADADDASASSEPAQLIAEADTAVDSAASMFGVADVPGGLALSPADPGESSSLMLAPEPGAIRSKADVDAERRAWLQRQRRIWLGLSVAQSTGAMLDAWSTRRVVASGRGQETNALLRPFAGNGSMYAAIQVGPLLLDYVSRRMMTSQHTVLRRTWWVPQVVGSVVSFSCFANNLAVYSAH